MRRTTNAVLPKRSGRGFIFAVLTKCTWRSFLLYLSFFLSLGTFYQRSGITFDQLAEASVPCFPDLAHVSDDQALVSQDLQTCDNTFDAGLWRAIIGILIA